MAKRVQVLLVDDVDGSAADETVTFGLDGVEYEIDLSAANAAKLRDGLATWVGHATRSGGRKSSGKKSGGARGRQDIAQIRDWARGQGYTVSDRGRISADIQEAYDKANS